MNIGKIPGLARNVARADRLEDYWRDYAFLGLGEELNIAGRRIEVRLLTLRMFVQLCAVQSPFLVGGRIRPEHVAQILWRLSPQYDARLAAPDARKNFIAAISALPFRAAVRAISRFVDRMLIDSPPSSCKAGAKPDTSFAASLIHLLASNYGWSPDQILDTPMPALFQFVKKIQREQASARDIVIFNPLRDRFIQRITNRFLGQRQAARAAVAALQPPVLSETETSCG